MKNEMDDLLSAVFGSRRSVNLGGVDANQKNTKKTPANRHGTAHPNVAGEVAAPQDDPIAALYANTASTPQGKADRAGTSPFTVAADNAELPVLTVPVSGASAGSTSGHAAASAATPAAAPITASAAAPVDRAAYPAAAEAATASAAAAASGTTLTPSAAENSGLVEALTAANGLQQSMAEMSAVLTERLAAQTRDIAALEALSPSAPADNATDLSDASLAAQRETLSQFSQTALDDLARIRREVNTPAVQNLSTAQDGATVAPGTAGAGAEAFNGLADALGKAVFGQADYLQKLAIAFKRPYVMGHTGSATRGAILITGKPCTGRHLSLSCAATELKARGVLATDEIIFLDLSLYPTPSEEKLFLQDLYMALAGAAEIVVFTRYEACHTGFLNVLRALVQTGKSPLSTRYVLQNGRLIDVGTALVQDAVSELTPRGKYLLFLTEQPVAKLADRLGAPFVSALNDVCETASLTAEALTQIANAAFDKLQTRAKTALQYDVTAEPEILQLGVNASGVSGGASGLLAYFDKAYRALAQYKLTHDSAEKAAALCVENGKPSARFDSGEPLDLFALLSGDYAGELEAVKAELNEIVGLTEIKQYVLSLEDNFKVQARRKEQGLKTADVSMHMIFTGNPGTGKTTIARLVSRYLKAIGVLSGGQLVEVTRADLVGKYVGHTAPLTTQVLRSAIGGVLFIDEAYSLYRGNDDSFGLEAIDTLVKGMEDNRDNLIVILAGYSDEMAEFLTSNSGLKSRFPNIIEFPNYTGEELLSIIKIQAKSKGYTLDEACDSVLLSYFNAVQLVRARDAGNGRLARNKVEEAILNQSKRLLHEPDADLSLLTTQDFSLNDVGGNA